MLVPVDAEPTAPQSRTSAWAYVLPLLGLAWLLVTPWLVFGAVITSAPFFGEPPSAAEIEESRRLMSQAALVGVGLPLVGLLLSRYLQLRWSVWIFAVALVVGCLVVLVSLVSLA